MTPTTGMRYRMVPALLVALAVLAV